MVANLAEIAFFGEPGNIQLSSNWEITDSRKGISTASFTFTGGVEELYKGRPRVGSQHPWFSFMVLETRKIRGRTGGFAELRLNYAGLDPETGDGDSTRNTPESRLIVGSQAEPVETNSKFQEFAGTASEPLNGARFVDFETGEQTTDDSRGVFKEFALFVADGDNFVKNEGWAGFEDFLDHQNVIWQVTYTSKQLPDFTNLHKIADEVPGEPPIPNAGGYTWLKLPPTYEPRANNTIYVNTESYRFGKWKPEAYAAD